MLSKGKVGIKVCNVKCHQRGRREYIQTIGGKPSDTKNYKELK